MRRSIRLEANVSLREVAGALGVNPMTVLRWEQGAEPRRETAIRYKKLLNELQRISAAS